MPSALSGAASRAEQAAARPPVWVECSRCSHEWQSRAKDRMTIKCPECGTGQRVPYRTHENTGAAPEGYRAPAPSRARSARPAPAWEPDDDPADEWENDDPEDGPQRTPLTAWMRAGGREDMLRTFPPGGAPGGLAGILAALGRRPSAPLSPAPAPRFSRPAPAPAPAPVRRPAVPAPAPVRPAPVVQARPAVQPIDPQTLPERELRRRDDVCQIARSVSTGTSLLVWYNQPPGACEALDTNQPKDRQRCPARATHAVRFQRDVTEADAYTCPEHARPLAAIADRTPYITATVYRLK